MAVLSTRPPLPVLSSLTLPHNTCNLKFRAVNQSKCDTEREQLQKLDDPSNCCVYRNIIQCCLWETMFFNVGMGLWGRLLTTHYCNSMSHTHTHWENYRERERKGEGGWDSEHVWFLMKKIWILLVLYCGGKLVVGVASIWCSWTNHCLHPLHPSQGSLGGHVNIHIHIFCTLL